MNILITAYMEILNGTSMELLAYSVEKCDKMDIYLGSYRILIFYFWPLYEDLDLI